MHTASQVRLGPIYKAEKPLRNPAYKRFVKGFACVACGSTRLVDPAHTGDHGLGSKSSDFSVIPLCREHHVEMDADPRGFEVVHDIDVDALIAVFNKLWEARKRRKV
jgi:hypothetical protein